jgi:hypothetical protein
MEILGFRNDDIPYAKIKHSARSVQVQVSGVRVKNESPLAEEKE